MSLEFILPQSFDPEDFLPGRGLRWREDARFFISTLMLKSAYLRCRCGKNSARKCRCRAVVLHKKYLDNVMSREYSAEIIRRLIDGGAIQKRLPYRVGSHSFGYQLGERFRQDRHVRRPVEDKRLARRMQSSIQAATAVAESRFNPIHRLLQDSENGLGIDAERAAGIVARLGKSNAYDAQGIQVANIAAGRHKLSVGRTGRVFNDITSLKSELRQTLRCEGEQLVGFDIANSQPAFLARTMNEQIREFERTHEANSERQTSGGERHTIGTLSEYRIGVGIDSSTSNYDSGFSVRRDGFDWSKSEYRKDARDFAYSAQIGRVYEDLVFAVNQFALEWVVQIERGEIKRQFLRDFLAWTQLYPPGLVAQAFRQAHPVVYEFVRWFNRNNYCDLIRHLQRSEAGFVIDDLCGLVFSRHPGMFIITLHDSVYCKASDSRSLSRRSATPSRRADSRSR